VRVANESGVAAIDTTGRVLDAGWSRGLDETIAWIEAAAAGGPALLFVDAPLWARHGMARCQVLGLPANPSGNPTATIIAPARAEQRPNSVEDHPWPRER